MQTAFMHTSAGYFDKQFAVRALKPYGNRLRSADRPSVSTGELLSFPMESPSEKQCGRPHCFSDGLSIGKLSSSPLKSAAVLTVRKNTRTSLAMAAGGVNPRRFPSLFRSLSQRPCTQCKHEVFSENFSQTAEFLNASAEMLDLGLGRGLLIPWLNSHAPSTQAIHLGSSMWGLNFVVSPPSLCLSGLCSPAGVC